jgi:hypothetical protein
MSIALHQPPIECGPITSPLLLADRLLTLAQDAERAGLPVAATRLLELAFQVCDQKPKRLS